MTVVKLSTLFTGQLNPPGNISVTVQLKCDGTRWRTRGKWGENWRMEWV